MSCIVLQDTLNGNIRLVREGVPYRAYPTEKVIGADPSCAGTIEVIAKPEHDVVALRNELDIAIGSGTGDLIKVLATPFAKLLGKTNCTSCEARRLVTNAYAQLKEKHGQFKALTIIKDLWKMSFTADGDAVLEELKKQLGESND